MRKIVLVALLLSLGLNSQAQSTDTLSIYFEFGKSEIPSKQLRKVRAIPHRVYINDLDSVYFIGMADSVGSIRSNLILGKKRAKEVARRSKDYFITKPRIVVMSRGERADREPKYNRRVDVIFFHKAKEIVKDTIAESKEILGCFVKADSLLHRCLVRDIIYRREPYVSVETIWHPRKRDFFSARSVKTDSGSDSMVVYPLRWRRSKLSSREALGSVYALIPREDFETYSIFTMDSTPCEGCGLMAEEYAEEVKYNDTTCLQVDRFLMAHLQTRSKLIRNAMYRVRVPKSLVDRSTTYYIGCYNENQVVGWRSIPNQKKWTRWNKNTRWQRFLNKLFKKRREKKKAGPYYYTELPSAGPWCATQITREMDCCEVAPEPSECEKCYPIGGPGGALWCYFRGGGPAFYLNAEAGYLRNDTRGQVYGALGFDLEYHQGPLAFSRLSLKLGVTDTAAVYCQAKLDQTWLVLPVYGVGAMNTWSYIGSTASPRFNVMLNSGIRTTYTGASSENFILNHGVFVELEVCRWYAPKANSFFVNYGYGVNTGSSFEFNNSPMIQAGFRWRIAGKYPRTVSAYKYGW